MPEDRPSATSRDADRRSSAAPEPRPLNWRSLTPSVSLAVFIAVGIVTIDSTGTPRLGVALIAGLVLGAPLSYLFDTYWPRIKTGADGDTDTPGAPTGS